MLCLAPGLDCVPCAGYSEILILKHLRALSAVHFPGLGQELAEPWAAAGTLPTQRSLLLRWVVAPRPQPAGGCPSAHMSGHPHPTWEQAEPGHVSASARSSAKDAVPKRSEVGLCCGKSCRSSPFRAC